MTAKRVFFALLASFAVLVVAVGAGVYGISSLLKVKASQLATAKAQVQQLTTKQTGLAKSKHEVSQYASLESVTKSIVPQDKDQAEAVLEITNIADANQVALTSINFTNSTLGASATPSGAAPIASATPAPAAASNAKSALSQLTPVPNIPGVYNLQITIANNANNSVTFSQLEAFLRGLENNRRTAQVGSLSIQPQTGDPDKIVFSLIVNDYIKPQ